MESHILDEAKPARLESARMFMPGWLVRAFELAVGGDVDLHAEASEFGLLRPRYDGGELVFLSLLLGELQRQLLLGDSKAGSVAVSFDVAKGNLTRFDPSHRDKMLRVFETLGQLRFFLGGKDSEFEAIRLFSAESWLMEPGGQSPAKLTLKQEEYTAEVVTGLIDAHMDLMRILRGGPELRALAAGQKPLVIWTPVWLELTVPEQLVYLRMESVMQTHGSWLRLDGLTGAPVNQLMRGMRIGKRQTATKLEDQNTGLLEQLRLFGRLGRRLVAHGVIRKQPENGFMATERRVDSSSPSLLWQASAERLRSKAESDYAELVANRLLLRASTEQIEGLLSLFAGLAGPGRVFGENLRRIWDQIRGLPSLALASEPGVILQGHFLFLEWVARSNPEAIMPLPEKIQASRYADVIKNVSPENALQRFRDFCLILGEKDAEFDLQDEAKSGLPSTVAKGKGLGVLWLNRLAELVRSSHKHPKKPEDLRVFSETRSSVMSRLDLSKSVNTSEAASGEAGAKAIPNTQRLHKLACQELEKMIYRSPADYVALKRRYISSLDSETRSMVLNVERRLDSRDFDRQLRTRLVRFMVDNPSSWSSTTSALPV